MLMYKPRAHAHAQARRTQGSLQPIRPDPDARFTGARVAIPHRSPHRHDGHSEQCPVIRLPPSATLALLRDTTRPRRGRICATLAAGGGGRCTASGRASARPGTEDTPHQKQCWPTNPTSRCTHRSCASLALMSRSICRVAHRLISSSGAVMSPTTLNNHTGSLISQMAARCIHPRLATCCCIAAAPACEAIAHDAKPRAHTLTATRRTLI